MKREHETWIFADMNRFLKYPKDNFTKMNVFSIFRDDGNVALAKMIMDKASDSMSQELGRM